MNSMIETENLTVGYNDPIIKDICLKLESGKILTLIGASGSGKSTVLKTIGGYIKKLGGSVFINGENTDLLSEKDLAKEMSVLLTERVTPRLLTCREVVEMGRYPYTGRFGMLTEKDRDSVEKAIRSVDIGDIAEREFANISDGQRQRVMLASAICRESKILLLDEPTSFLDIHYKIRFLETVKNIAENNNTAVVISMHEIDLARKIADFAVCVKNGRIVYRGEPQEVFSPDIVCDIFDLPKELYRKYFDS